MKNLIWVLVASAILSACGDSKSSNSKAAPATYTIGGTVTGLTSDTLVLNNNGGNALSLTASGAFTFSNSVESNGNYLVAIATQPKGQTCSITSGSGSAAANVTNVAVSCVKNTFALGGAVTGLSSGNSLTLLNNGVNSLVVSTNAEFQFTATVDYNGAYAITVGIQPVGQTCIVTNGSGSASANVTNVAVSCVKNTFALGGAVTGLSSGDSLTLLNNGVNSLVVSANSAFQFTAPVDYNGAYAITVGTQPVGQECTVANGSGSSVAANITNLTITCTATKSTVLWSFGGTGDGTTPQSRLIQDANGLLYGTTYDGGANNKGSIYTITPAGTESVLFSFAQGAPEGESSDARLVLAADGNFYSTSLFGGGPYNGGTFFKVTPTGVTTTLWSFGGPGDASLPQENIIQGTDGNFYGVTYLGGQYGKGTIFKVTPTGTETVLWSFGAAGDGATPYAGITQGADGNFYGTTIAGGANNKGTFFKMTPAGALSVLWSFGGAGDSAEPVSRLLQTQDGTFYGVANTGGANNLGTVFKITPAGVETVLWSFGATGDGTYPIGELTLASDGNFYGTTFNGGAFNDSGTIFKLTPSGVETVLWSFGGAGDGKFPLTGLLQASDGHLYGTTMQGGANDKGTVFHL